MSSIDGVSSKVVDVSAEGVRLEITGASPSALPPYFTLRVPGFGVAAKVKRVWVAMPAQGSMWCGGDPRAADREDGDDLEQVHRERAARRAADHSRSGDAALGGGLGVLGLALRLGLAPLPESAQSDSNTCRIFCATAGLLMINPTSRRFSSSSFRRL